MAWYHIFHILTSSPKLTWMEPMLAAGELQGKIICPNDKCGAKIGSYDWAGVQCGCKEWVVPVSLLRPLKRVPNRISPSGKSGLLYLSKQGGRGLVNLICGSTIHDSSYYILHTHTLPIPSRNSNNVLKQTSLNCPCRTVDFYITLCVCGDERPYHPDQSKHLVAAMAIP